jgi:hypothetical protein
MPYFGKDSVEQKTVAETLDEAKESVHRMAVRAWELSTTMHKAGNDTVSKYFKELSDQLYIAERRMQSTKDMMGVRG